MKRTMIILAIAALGISLTEVTAQRRGEGRRGAAAFEDQDREGRGEGRGRRGRRRANPVIVALDVDKDGTLSAEEIENAATALLTLDKNEDGQLTPEEMRPPRGEGRGQGRGERGKVNMAERIMSYDDDGDGQVTASEMPERMTRLLERADTNEDGAVSQEEAEALGEQMKGRGWGRGGPPRDRDDNDEEE